MSRMLPVPVNSVAERRRGLLLMMVGSLTIPLLDAVAKVLGDVHQLPAGEIALARFVIQSIMIFPLVILSDGIAALRVQHPGLNLLRGALLGLGSFTFFLALKFMPLADATAIFFVEPMLVTILSGLVLKESIGWRRIVAVLAGLAGALIVIRPSFTSLGLVAGLPLLTAAAVAAYSILSRRLSAGSTPLAAHFYAGLGGTLALAALTLVAGDSMPEFALVAPEEPAAWALLLAIGAIAAFSHFFFLMAYRLAPASVLAPFGYLEIISATLLGLALFGDFPAPVAWLGIAVIVASGTYIFLHERTSAGETASEPMVAP